MVEIACEMDRGQKILAKWTRETKSVGNLESHAQIIV
jgi:hypothetical protein